MAEAVPGTDRIGIVEASLDAQLGLLSSDEQQQLGERLADRLGWIQTAGGLVVAQTAEFTLVRDDYDLTVAAVGDLGVKSTKKQPIPEFEEVAEAISTQSAVYLGEHVARGDQPELAFHIPFAGRFDLRKLVSGFDKKQQYPTAVWDKLWHGFSNVEHNHGISKLTAALILNDTTRGSDHSEQVNEYGEAGLVHENKTVPEQRATFSLEQELARTADVQLDLESISQYVVVQAKRRHAGLSLLDKQTVTRFPQYADKRIGGFAVVPGAGVGGVGPLGLGGSYVDNSWDNNGVRRGMRVGS